MLREFIHASGYLFILLPPGLLLCGVATETYALAIVGLFGVAPFLRIIFGDAPDTPPQWREGVATALDWLPGIYAVIFFACLGSALTILHSIPPKGLQWLWLGTSLWAVFIFASCAAHELLHRRSNGSRLIGRMLSGSIGYPVLEFEHRAHHAVSGLVGVPEWPALSDSVWSFSGRRMLHVLSTAWEGNVAAAQRDGRSYFGGLTLAVASMLATACAFWLSLGFIGMLFYLLVSIAVFWAVQAITFVQHWGLGRDSLPEAEHGKFGWEDGCRLQRWLTLSISFHQAHHCDTTVPYYRQTMEAGSPRMPGGYVVLLIASLIPTVWRALMLPSLALWKAAPDTQEAPGRRLLCFARPAAASASATQAREDRPSTWQLTRAPHEADSEG